MITNPYNIQGSWYKGNLHTHTSNSCCGHYSVEKVIEIYTSYQMEYDFLAITDHHYLTRLSDYMDDDRIILFQGVEFKKSKYQTLGINISVYRDKKNDSESNIQELFDDINAQKGFNVICHPHIYQDDYWPVEMLQNLTGYFAIEVFNNNVKANNAGRAVATDVWDYLLSNGKKVAGLANDDMHVFHRAGTAFNMVLAEERSRKCIIDSLFNHRFYASTGVTINTIEVSDRIIRIGTKLSVTFRFIGKGPVLLNEQTGSMAEYKCTGNESYIRVELIREDGAMAWTQPFYIMDRFRYRNRGNIYGY